MRISLMIEGQEGVTWDDWLALAQACERYGLEGLFRSDHYGSLFTPDRGSLDAWATLSALAAVTERILLGTMVSPATFRHPSELAKVVATVDHVSRGRVELGLGAGWNEPEHLAYGFPFGSLSERIGRLAEQLEIVRKAWELEEFNFEGRFYRLKRCRALPKPFQEPHPPLIVGGAAKPRALDLAARWADEYNTTFVAPEEAKMRRQRLVEACARVGRQPLTFSVMTLVVIGSDREEVVERAHRAMVCLGIEGDPRAFLDQRRDSALVGTLEEVAARLFEYEKAGVERMTLQHPDHEDLETVALLGQLP